jgi:hypothetical protein
LESFGVAVTAWLNWAYNAICEAIDPDDPELRQPFGHSRRVRNPPVHLGLHCGPVAFAVLSSQGAHGPQESVTHRTRIIDREVASSLPASLGAPSARPRDATQRSSGGQRCPGYFRACLVGGMMPLSAGLGFGCLGCLGLRTSRPPLFFDMMHSRADVR